MQTNPSSGLERISNKAFRTQAALIRRHARLTKDQVPYFDYLVDCYCNNSPVTALRIAASVLGNTSKEAEDKVRPMMRRLRDKLQKYYERTGQQDPVEIEIPKENYALIARHRNSTPAISSL